VILSFLLLTLSPLFFFYTIGRVAPLSITTSRSETHASVLPRRLPFSVAKTRVERFSPLFFFPVLLFPLYKLLTVGGLIREDGDLLIAMVPTPFLPSRRRHGRAPGLFFQGSLSAVCKPLELLRSQFARVCSGVRTGEIPWDLPWGFTDWRLF